MDKQGPQESHRTHYSYVARERGALFRIVFGSGNTAARLFDIVLSVAILASVLQVMVDSIVDPHRLFHHCRPLRHHSR
jgi:hypothetical protein